MAGDGDDFLEGRNGADRLTGGGGSDTFIVTPGEGGATIDLADVILDFEDGVDLIGLGGEIGFGDIVIGETPSGDAVISFVGTGEFLAVLEGVSASQLDSSDFVSIFF